MISPYHFLTAGHCVYDSTAGGWASSLQISLGRDGTNLWYGTANATYMRTYTGWTQSADENHDWALVTLDVD